MAARQCPFCGKVISDLHTQCPFCRETLSTAPGSQTLTSHVAKRSGNSGNRKIRQGLLYMLLAAVIQYFAGGYSNPLKVPIHIQPMIAAYLAPLLFLGGLGLSIYGFYLHAKP
jgi:hypothetical protein